MHSHPATRQDTWVTAICPAPGYYIEIGAYDGIKHSNTLYLQEQGWRGLLVEGNPRHYAQLKQNRPAEQCRNDTIVGKHLNPENLAGFVNGDQYGGLYAYMPEAWKLEHHRRGNTCIQVATTTIDEFWEREGIGAYIDYLSLDTEGSEYTILKSFSHLDKVRLLTVEFRYDNILLQKYCDLLEPTHQLDQLRGFDACFIKRGVWSVSSCG